MIKCGTPFIAAGLLKMQPDVLREIENLNFGSETWTRLGEQGKGEIWECAHCKNIVPGEQVVMDYEADSYACPYCYCWDSLACLDGSQREISSEPPADEA